MRSRRETVAAIRAALERRSVVRPANPRTILEHLERVWPGGLEYNAWYFLHTAQRLGLLDEGFRPVPAEPICEEARRMAELFRLGGGAAVGAYVDLEYGR